MLRSLLTTTALVALLAGGSAAAQTAQDTSAAKPETAAEGSVSTQGQTEGAAEIKAEEAAEPKPEAEMKAESETKADTAVQSAARATGFVTEQDGEQVLASEYIGQEVVNAQDETIGTISDLVMDRDGRVTAAVIGVGGFLGLGEKDVGVPIEAIEVRSDAEGEVQLVMQSTREELESAPEFVDLEDQMEAQEAARREEERQQMQQQMNSQGTTAPATGTTN